MVDNKRAVPFLKWAGGKSLIADKVISKLGTLSQDSTYFEAFLGGGAVFFKLRPRRAVLIDSNTVLIRTYEVVKDRVENLISELMKLSQPQSKEEFEEARSEFNGLLPPSGGSLEKDDVLRSALLIWLNHTCFNGLYRVNKDGRFNVPYGYYKNPQIFDPENLRAASTTLRRANTKLIAGDYSLILNMAKTGDAVYLDPPYHPIDKTSNFTSYTSQGFDLSDQEKLSYLVHDLVKRGCQAVVSNSLTRDIMSLYSDMNQDRVHVPRAINCIGTKRGAIPELIIYPKKKHTKHEQWEKVIEESKLTLDGTHIYEISSNRVKEITGEEPRLVAKMDTREDLPRLLSSQGYFVLPVSNRKYALVPGDGYHDLEKTDDDPVSFSPIREVPVTVALKAGESAAIQTALYSGLLEKVVGIKQLRPTLHNDRIRINNTVIRYRNKWTLNITGAQAEVDAGFEDHKEFFIFECKNWYHSQLKNFNIRQLFFPFLHARNSLVSERSDWKIRCFFLNVEPDTTVYRFWEYEFPIPNDYANLRFVRQSAFELSQSHRARPNKVIERLVGEPISQTDYLPQADDPQKLLGIVQGISKGYDTPEKISQWFKFDIRQSNYYGEAAEELGIIDRDRGRFVLTDAGLKIVRLSTDTAIESLIERIFTLPVFNRIVRYAIENKTDNVPTKIIKPIMKECSGGRYNETTIQRRTQTVTSWLNWVGETTGAIRVQPLDTFASKTLYSY